MKKFAFILLSVFSVTLAGCGTTGNNSEKKVESKSEQSTKENEKKAKTSTSTTTATKNDNSQKSTVQSNTTQSSPSPSNDFQPKFHPEISAESRQGGLGDTFDQLKKQFGEPNQTNQKMSNGSGQYNYQNDYQVVAYTEGRVSNIIYQLDSKNQSMSEQQAKQFALSMMPTDSTLIKQNDKDENTMVLLYHSKSLESLFDQQQFTNANGEVNPGQFDIVLTHNGDQVNSLGAMLGDNP